MKARIAVVGRNRSQPFRLNFGDQPAGELRRLAVGGRIHRAGSCQFATQATELARPAATGGERREAGEQNSKTGKRGEPKAAARESGNRLRQDERAEGEQNIQSDAGSETREIGKSARLAGGIRIQERSGNSTSRRPNSQSGRRPEGSEGELAQPASPEAVGQESGQQIGPEGSGPRARSRRSDAKSETRERGIE